MKVTSEQYLQALLGAERKLAGEPCSQDVKVICATLRGLGGDITYGLLRVAEAIENKDK